MKDLAIPSEERVNMKESVRKMDKYINLARCLKVTVVPIVIGALGAIPKKLENYLKELDIRKKG